MKVLAFIGPSGSGKSTVVRELDHRSVIAVTPSWTTRPRRDDEGDGVVEHRFVSDEEFDALERDGFFLEVVRMFGLPYRYGLPAITRPPPGVIPVVMVRASLLALVGAHYPHHVVYQIEASPALASSRLLQRSRTNRDIGARLDEASEERALGRRLAHRIFDGNRSVAQIVDAVQSAILADFHFERSERR